MGILKPTILQVLFPSWEFLKPQRGNITSSIPIMRILKPRGEYYRLPSQAHRGEILQVLFPSWEFLNPLRENITGCVPIMGSLNPQRGNITGSIPIMGILKSIKR